MIGPSAVPISWAIRVDRLPVSGRRGREAGLDDIDLEPRQLPRDLELLVAGHRAARRLLAIAQGRVKNTYMIGSWVVSVGDRGWERICSLPLCPCLCSTLSGCYLARVDKGHHAPQRHADLLRSGAGHRSSRMRLKFGRPVWFSSIQSSANAPLWMLCSSSRIVALWSAR